MLVRSLAPADEVAMLAMPDNTVGAATCNALAVEDSDSPVMERALRTTSGVKCCVISEMRLPGWEPEYGYLEVDMRPSSPRLGETCSLHETKKQARLTPPSLDPA